MGCPIAYLITFTTYGTWLHGDKRGSVDKEHNRYGSAFVNPNSGLNKKELISLKNPPFALEKNKREVVLKAILQVCELRGWFAHVVHVRRSHVHIVVSGDVRPEKMLVDFKAYSTRALRKYNNDQTTVKKYWTHHGSTKYIWTKESLATTIKYVRDEQSKLMAFGATENQSPER